MDYKDILDEIQIDDMPSQDMILVAENCGVETALTLMRTMGGMGIYIPKHPFYKMIERVVKTKRSVNYKDIAMAFGVSERYIRNLWVKQKKEHQKTQPKLL